MYKKPRHPQRCVPLPPRGSRDRATRVTHDEPPRLRMQLPTRSRRHQGLGPAVRAPRPPQTCPRSPGSRRRQEPAVRPFDTTLPSLVFVNPSLVNPPEVFCLRPKKTEDFAREPFATTLTFFALFMARFIAAPFMAGALMAIALFVAIAFSWAAPLPRGGWVGAKNEQPKPNVHWERY